MKAKFNPSINGVLSFFQKLDTKISFTKSKISPQKISKTNLRSVNNHLLLCNAKSTLGF